MIYSEVQPHTSLSNYIDAYWTAKGDSKENTVEKILPDGCVDIIFNFGSECSTDNGTFAMKSEGTFLVGTMTRFKGVLMNAETNLVGIRFKPGAVSAFHKFPSLHEVTNQTIELDKSLPFDTKRLIPGTADYLNHYFTEKLKNPNHFLLQVIETIRHLKGQVKVDTLAQRHFTTVRQLERIFKQFVGASPKEFINLVRYQNAMIAIQQRKPGQSLLSIAIDFGYYDHSHLTDEFKRYNGVVPTLI